MGRNSRYLKVLWLIPILILGYIGWVNLSPLGGTATYFIDVGGEDTGGKARITGPFDRISGVMLANGTSFRELEDVLVYFDLDSRDLGNADEVSVRVRFRDNFPGDARFMLGARDKKERSYYWRDIYVPFYEQLAGLPVVAADGNTTVYATGEESSASFESVDEFLQNPPLGAVIARNNSDLSIDQRVSPQEWGEMDRGEFATGDAFPIPLAGDVDENSYIEIDASLRGTHTFFFFAASDTLELQITKRDLNWYEGEDMLDVEIYSLDGTLQARKTIPDDGNVASGRKLGDPQSLTLRLDNLETGTYRLALEAVSEGSDLLITQLGLNQPKLVAINKLFLAGNLYLGEEPQPTAVWSYIFSEGEVKFSTPQDSALQSITVSGEGYNLTLNIDARGEWFSTGLLEPGIYQITSEKGDVIIEAPNGYFAFTEDSLFLPASSSNREENGDLVINTTLRRGRTLWTYATGGSLELEVTKQDLNWYEGPDGMEIEVYSLDGDLVGNATIPDDGDVSAGAELGPPQSQRLSIPDLEPGAYKLELKSGGDLLIRRIEINQEKLVVEKRVFLVGMNTAYFKNGLPVDPVSLYLRDFRGSEARFLTLHRPGLQRIIIAGSGLPREIEVTKAKEWFNATLEPGVYQLTVPRQDIIVDYDGYMSFTPDSFFLPQRSELLGLKYDLSWIQEKVDYVVIDYVAPVEDDGWLIAQATWKREDLFIKDNKLSFSFNVPHLAKPEQQDATIPIDWIEISLEIPSIWERLGD